MREAEGLRGRMEKGRVLPKWMSLFAAEPYLDKSIVEFGKAEACVSWKRGSRRGAEMHAHRRPSHVSRAVCVRREGFTPRTGGKSLDQGVATTHGREYERGEIERGFERV